MNSIHVRLLASGDEPRYDDFIASGKTFTPSVTRQYLSVLERALPGVVPVVFLAEKAGEIVGVLPCCRMDNAELGGVLNSLPFFGSVGGVLQKGDDDAIHAALLRAVDHYCAEQGIVAATIISSPLDLRASCYPALFKPTAVDERIALINVLPEGGADLEQRLMSQYHESRRRNVRKAERLGIEVTRKNDRAAFDFLERTHVDNISAIGGLTKPRSFFRAVEELMDQGDDYRLYQAELDGEPVASLLLLYSGQVVEYFTPALKHEHRPTQALCGIIHQAMLEAAKAGYRYWNWGGTWKTQTSLYTFKKKWGAQESTYDYYTRLYPGSEKLFAMEPAEVLAAFPCFYVFPFGMAGSNRDK